METFIHVFCFLHLLLADLGMHSCNAVKKKLNAVSNPLFPGGPKIKKKLFNRGLSPVTK